MVRIGDTRVTFVVNTAHMPAWWRAWCGGLGASEAAMQERPGLAFFPRLHGLSGDVLQDGSAVPILQATPDATAGAFVGFRLDRLLASSVHVPVQPAADLLMRHEGDGNFTMLLMYAEPRFDDDAEKRYLELVSAVLPHTHRLHPDSVTSQTARLLGTYLLVDRS